MATATVTTSFTNHDALQVALESVHDFSDFEWVGSTLFAQFIDVDNFTFGDESATEIPGSVGENDFMLTGSGFLGLSWKINQLLLADALPDHAEFLLTVDSAKGLTIKVDGETGQPASIGGTITHIHLEDLVEDMSFDFTGTMLFAKNSDGEPTIKLVKVTEIEVHDGVNHGTIMGNFSINVDEESPLNGKVTGFVTGLDFMVDGVAFTASDFKINAAVVFPFTPEGDEEILFDIEAMMAEILKGNDIVTGGVDSEGQMLNGYAGNDVITPMAVGAVLVGGDGNDRYLITADTDDGVSITEESTAANAKAGKADTVVTTVSLSLAGHANVENLELAEEGDDINGTGNDLVNKITGNDAPNILDGGAGNDSIVGGDGDDEVHVNLIVVGAKALIDDKVSDTGGTDNLVVHAEEDLVLPGVKPFKLTMPMPFDNLDLENTGELAIDVVGTKFDNVIFGNAGANSILGGDGNDDLYGGGGSDFLDGGKGNDDYHGGAGDDSFVIADAGDAIESDTSGIDTILLAIATGSDYNVLVTDDFLENITYIGAGNVTLTGNNENNVLTGGKGHDILIGGGGEDEMNGGTGNDVITVDSLDDIVSGGTGTDTVISESFFYALADNNGVERLTLEEGSEARNGVGNNLANLLTGNSGDNMLWGWLGKDTVVGGGGMDTFVIGQLNSTAADVVTLMDFDQDDDLIGLDSDKYAPILGGDGVMANEVVNGTVANQAFAQLIYKASTGQLYYDADGSGTSFKAVLIGVFAVGARPTELEFGDFISVTGIPAEPG